MKTPRLGLWVVPALVMACSSGAGHEDAAAEEGSSSEGGMYAFGNVDGSPNLAEEGKPVKLKLDACGLKPVGDPVHASAGQPAEAAAPAEPQEIVYGEGFQGEPKKVETLEGGVKIEDFAVGTGPAIENGQFAFMHYTGWTSMGVQFDSSLDRGKPLEFPLGAGRVIKGWDVGVAGMKKGGRRRITIPPEMGYGARAMGPKLPANSTLIFTVELVDMKDPPPPPKGPEAFAGAPKRTFTTEGGVLVEVFGTGKGAKSKKGDTLAMHYTGTVKADGSQFDSSVPRGQPFSFPLGAGRVIKGWDEGLVDMQVGELRRITIPYALAYGETGRPPKIPPQSDLIFTVELMDLTPAP